MADTQFMRINNKFALAYDRNQWVLQRRKVVKGREHWRAVAFSHYNKYHLFAVMIRAGVPKDDALDICELLPISFIEFLAETNASSGYSAGVRAISGKDDLDHPKLKDAPHTAEYDEAV